MSVILELGLKVGLLIALLVGYLWFRRRDKPLDFGPKVTWGVVAFGFFSWLNWGAFHTDGTFLHHWDQFHYFVNSKYFPELKYDGLYVASVEALSEAQPGFVPPKRIRDLRLDRIVEAGSTAAHQREVRARFSDGRWQAFKEDLVRIPVDRQVFLDRGYNAPPPLTGMMRALTSWLPIRKRSMLLLGLLDTSFVVGSLVLVGRSYGPGVAALCSLLLGTGFLSRFFWVGGAFMRHDWLFAVVASLCALKRERYALAGAAMGYAVAARIFPVLLLVPLVGWFARDWRQRRVAALRLGSGLALAGALLFGVGALGGGGLAAYGLSYAKLSAHNRVPVGNAIGARAVLSASVDSLLGKLTDPVSVYEFNAMDDDMLRVAKERAPWLAGVVVVGLLVSLLLGYRAASAADATVLGLVTVALAGNIGCYYWVLLVLLPLLQPTRGFLLGVTANLCMFGCGAAALAVAELGWVTRFSPSLVFVPCAGVVCAAVLVWCWPEWRGRAGLESPVARARA